MADSPNDNGVDSTPEPWNYFAADPGYSRVLRDRLAQGVEMDSAMAMGRYLNEKLDGALGIVDFGGGPGHYYPIIKQAYEKGPISYQSIDIDVDNIAFGQAFFADDPKASFVVGSVLEPAPHLMGNVNCVISANTLPHIPTIRPLLEAVCEAKNVKYFLFRMLIGEECVEIRKHLNNTSFENLFESEFQHNNIYSVSYIQAILGEKWVIEVLPDIFDIDRLSSHSVPMQKDNAFYGNRVSRSVGDMIFKGDIFMPWVFVFGSRRD